MVRLQIANGSARIFNDTHVVDLASVIEHLKQPLAPSTDAAPPQSTDKTSTLDPEACRWGLCFAHFGCVQFQLRIVEVDLKYTIRSSW